MFTLIQGRNYRLRNAGGRKGQGALCRREKEIVALGPKTSPGQGAHMVFLQGAYGVFCRRPIWCLLQGAHIVFSVGAHIVFSAGEGQNLKLATALIDKLVKLK